MRSKKRWILIVCLIGLGLSRMLAAYKLVPLNQYSFFLGPVAQVFSVTYRFSQIKVESHFTSGEVDSFQIRPGQNVERNLNLGYFTKHAIVGLMTFSHINVKNPGFEKGMKSYFCFNKNSLLKKEVNFYARNSETTDYQFKFKVNCGGL